MYQPEVGVSHEYLGNRISFFILLRKKNYFILHRVSQFENINKRLIELAKGFQTMSNLLDFAVPEGKGGSFKKTLIFFGKDKKSADRKVIPQTKIKII